MDQAMVCARGTTAKLGINDEGGSRLASSLIESVGSRNVRFIIVANTLPNSEILLGIGDCEKVPTDDFSVGYAVIGKPIRVDDIDTGDR